MGRPGLGNAVGARSSPLTSHVTQHRVRYITHVPATQANLTATINLPGITSRQFVFSHFSPDRCADKMSEHTVLTPHPTPSQSCRWNYKRKTTTVSIHIKFFVFYIAINIRDNEEFETADGTRLKKNKQGQGRMGY